MENKITLNEIIKKYLNKQALIHILGLPNNEQCGEYYVEEFEDYEQFEDFDEVEEMIDEYGYYEDIFLIASDGRGNFKVFDNYDSELDEILNKYGDKCFVETED